MRLRVGYFLVDLFESKNGIDSSFVLGRRSFRPNSKMIRFFASVGKCEFGDARLIKLSKFFRNHPVELLFSGLGLREVNPAFIAKRESDDAVLRCIGTGKEAGVVAVCISSPLVFQNLGVRTGLGKNLTKHCQIKPEGSPEPKALGEYRRVDVHHHVDECFDLGGFAGSAYVAQG